MLSSRRLIFLNYRRFQLYGSNAEAYRREGILFRPTRSRTFVNACFAVFFGCARLAALEDKTMKCLRDSYQP